MPSDGRRPEGSGGSLRTWWVTFYATGDEPDHHSLVIHADPTNNDAKMKLAEILEILNEPRKALDLVLQGMAVS